MMIGENIKKYRQQKGLSQEELAMKLNVVRQTISKYEKGLSVPDANILIKLSEILEVSVNTLLSIDEVNIADLQQRLNDYQEQISKNQQINQVRQTILFFSFLVLFFSLCIQNQLVLIILTTMCILYAIYQLYTHLELLSVQPMTTQSLKALKITTIFDVMLFISVIVLVILKENGMIKISLLQEKWLAVMIISSVMIFSGLVATKLPFSRHTGLRLPWNVCDESIWNVTHQVLRITAFVSVIIYVILTIYIENFEWVTLMAMIIWLGIPAIISFIYPLKK